MGSVEEKGGAAHGPFGPPTRPVKRASALVVFVWFMSVGETGLDVLPFEPWIIGEDRLRRVSGGQHAENVLDGRSPAADNRRRAWALAS